MKRPISLWILTIAGMVTNILSGIIFYPVFYMFTQFYLFTWVIFIASVVVFIPLQVFLCIGVLRLARRCFNIFFILTLAMNVLLFFYFSLNFPLLACIVVGFLVYFISYFVKPSTRKLFNMEQ